MMCKKNKIRPMEFTGERMVLGTNNYELEIEHLNRYHFGAQFVKDKRVLDVACGTGYGSAILAENAAFVEGIDISREAIDYAISNYSTHNIRFTQASVDKLPYPDNYFDVVISFETIEHVDGATQVNCLNEIKRVLVEDGILVISTPNHDIYKEKGENQFHIKELNYTEFNRLLMDYFKNVHFWGQEFEICNVIANSNDNDSIIQSAIQPEKAEYLIALCSQTSIKNVISRVIMRNDEKLRNLITWAVENDNINTKNNEYIATQSIKIEDQQRTIEYQSQNIERILTTLDIKDRFIERILDHEKAVVLGNSRLITQNLYELTREIEILLKKLSESDKKLSESNEKLTAFDSSTCWKITKPIRLVGDLLKSIKRSVSFNLKYLPSKTDDLDRPIEDASTHVSNSENNIQKKSKILVVDFRIPMFDISAGELATWGMLTDLVAVGFDVTYLPFDMKNIDEYSNKMHKNGINVITREQGFNDPFDYVLREGAQYETFYLIRVEIAEYLYSVIRTVVPEAKIIFHAVDVYFIRELREAILQNNREKYLSALLTKERELNIIKRADLTVVVSEEEKRTLQELLPSAKILVFPALYAEVANEVNSFTERKDIFFMGSYPHTPNADGVMWFVKEIWPLVHQKMPEVSFHIIGSSASDEIIRLGSKPGVIYKGYIKDISTILSTIRLGVAPLRYGAGIKGKVAMTLGAGVPCICTTIAAEGMSLIDGKDTMIEDDPESFAEAIIKVYDNKELWNSLSLNGREHIKRMFSKESNRRSLLSLLHSKGVIPSEMWLDYISKLNKLEDFPILAVPQYENPIVSIIIPVYNQFHYTYNCIDSIIANSGEIKYEIIVANDCSTDQTSRIDEVIQGIVLINNAENLNFLKNCNNAAKYAKGKYILFLNNDTQVQPNWLAPLVDLIEKDKQIGMVGSKLINPDGTLQEAGGIIFKDGSPCNYGRGSDPDLPEFNYVKEVDYISGASIMILRSLWEEIGGFDEEFAPAYCEDSDLAFTVRKLGYKVMYQPRSVVVHFEGISNGKDTSSGL